MNSYHSTYLACLDDTAKAIVSDNRERAQACVASLDPETSQRVEALLIRAWTCDSIQETEIALQQALEINPDNETAIAGLNWIHGIQDLAECQLEAKRQAEEAARLQAEEEARLQAEEAARLQAEEEARQHENESKLAAVEEAGRQAEIDEQTELESGEMVQAQAAVETQEHAELQTQVELNREALEMARARRQQELEQRQAIDNPEQSGESGSIENEIESSIVILAEEVKQEVRFDKEPESPTKKTEPTTPIPLVLAVDDSPTVRKLVALTLNSNGFEVITACDGVEALNSLAERLPDIILSDINMPKLNGYKLCKFVKKHERTRAIPVVMLSGKDGVFDKMRGKLNGCDDFICKPFESEQLISKVRQVLDAAVVR